MTEVRRAAEADAAAIAELLGQLGYPSSDEQVRTRLERFELMPGAEACRVTALAVAPNARRRGVGLALMEAAEALAREQGCFRVEVTCRSDRHAAHALYRDLGFEERRHRFAKELG